MSHRELDPSGMMITAPGRKVPIATDRPDRRSIRCTKPLYAMMTWCVIGSTTSCNGSCFQWAIPAPEESNAIRNGVVPSTRAISTSAERLSASGKSSRAVGAAVGSSMEYRKADLVTDVLLHQDE